MHTPEPQGIPCPECGGYQTVVKDSRHAEGQRRRRRLCEGGGHKFSTFEGAVNRMPRREVERLIVKLQLIIRSAQGVLDVLNEHREAPPPASHLRDGA